MTSIPHVRDSYWNWFESEECFMTRLDDLLFIGFQKHLCEDFEILKFRLRLPDELALPDDDFHSHVNPRHLDRTLGDVAVANLRKWYEKDFRFLELCDRVTGEPACPVGPTGRRVVALVDLRSGGTNGGH